MGKWDVDNREKFGVKINPSDPKAEYLADKLSGSLEADTVNNKIGLDGDEASPTASKYYGTNAASEKGFHALPDGITVIDDDTFATATSENVASAESVKAYVDTEISDNASDITHTVGTAYTLASASTERGEGGTTYVKLKEIKMAWGGVVTVSFDFRWYGITGSGTAYARIYVNGIAVGTEQTDSWSPVQDYENYSENITIKQGDLIQIYCKNSGDGASFIKNLLVKSAVPETTQVITD